MDKALGPRSNAPPRPSAVAKLALVEALLAAETVTEASQLAVDWLARRRGVRQVAIAVVTAERTRGARLVIAASHGLEAASMARVSVDLDDRDHPLIHALGAGRATIVSGAALDATRLGLGAHRGTAFPLPTTASRDRDAVGLVLIDGASRDAEIKWLCGVLGRKLVDLRTRRVRGAEAQVRAERDRLEQKVRDATAELVTQNELLQRQALELEAASSAKSQFLANMSHEFRTPLNAILGYTSMLLQGVSGPLPPNVTRQLARVDSNGKHLLTIINDVLDIARIEAGKMPLNLSRFAIGALVEEVLAEVDPLIERAKLAVQTELGRSLPTVRSDRPKVKQILMNLVSNALKFTPSGTVTISARLDKRKSDVCLSVADTGIGISRADQEAVFQDFRQVDNSPTRQYGGTGLGLAICRRLAIHLGGDIRLVSTLGEGSTFTLVMPVDGGSR